MVSTFASIDPRRRASMARRAMLLGFFETSQKAALDCQGQHAIPSGYVKIAIENGDLVRGFSH